MYRTPIMIVSSALALGIVILATSLFFLGPIPAQGMVVGENVAAARTDVRLVDRVLPAPGTSTFTSSISSLITNVPVTITATSINTATRSVTFSVTMPSGYRLVHGYIQGSTLGAGWSISAADTDAIRNRIQTGSFPTQFSVNNLAGNRWDQLMNRTAYVRVLIVPIQTVDNITFHLHGGNPLSSTTINVVTPSALPTPTHPQNLPFLHWSLNAISNTPVRGQQLINPNGVELHAVWFHAPTGLRVNEGVLYWNPVIGAAGYRIYINDVFITTVSATSWSFIVETSRRAEFGPGAIGWQNRLDFQVRAVRGFNVGAVQSGISEPYQWNDNRRRLETPNLRVQSGSVLFWEPIQFTTCGEQIMSPYVRMQFDTHRNISNTFITRTELQPWPWSSPMVNARWACIRGYYFVSASVLEHWDNLPSNVNALLPRIDAPIPTIITLPHGYFLRWNEIQYADGYTIFVRCGTTDNAWNFPIRINTKEDEASGRILRGVGGDNDFLYIDLTSDILSVFSFSGLSVGMPIHIYIYAIPEDFEVNNTSEMNYYVFDAAGQRQIQLEVNNLRVENGLIVWDNWQQHMQLQSNMMAISINILVSGSLVWSNNLIDIRNWLDLNPGTHDITVSIDSWDALFIGTTSPSHTTHTIIDPLPTPALSIIGNQLSWAFVPGAMHYRVEIQPAGTTNWLMFSPDEIGLWLDLNEADIRSVHGIGTHSFRIVAIVNQMEQYLTNSLPSNTVAFTVNKAQVQLSQPTAITVTGQDISWTSGATTLGVYRVTIGSVSHDVTGNSFTWPTTFAAGAQYRIYVIALGTETATAIYLDSAHRVYVLEAPRNIVHLVGPTQSSISIDFVTGVVSWTSADSANTSYRITISRGATTLVTNEIVTGNNFTFTQGFSYGGIYTISLVAFAEMTATTEYIDSPAITREVIAPRQVIGLSAPSGIQVNGQKISWIIGAISSNIYSITIGGTTHEVIGNNFVWPIQFTRGNTYSISVMAVGKTTATTEYTSSLAVTHSHVVIGNLENLTLVNGVLSWDAVYGAEDYIIIVNGVEIEIPAGSGNRVSYNISQHLRYGNNTITVRAEGSDQYATAGLTRNISQQTGDDNFNIVAVLLICFAVILAFLLLLLIIAQRRKGQAQ